MAANVEASKRRRMMDYQDKEGEDRLSSLPDVILIEILSILPLKTAIKTEVLSSRWCNLWTQVTSFDLDINNQLFQSTSEYLSFYDQILKKLTSPFFHRFSVEFCGFIVSVSMDWWLRQVCKRNVLHLKVTWPSITKYQLEVPFSIFQIQSLLSIELGSAFGCPTPDKAGNPVKLPNLRKLSLYFTPSQCESLEKLIEGCPSLEELSVNVATSFQKAIFIKCSSPSLRRLSINLGFTEHNKVTIKTPKLEYLATYARTSTRFCFDDKPIGLHEASIQFFDPYGYQIPSSEFYRAISNVKILALNFNAINPFTHFYNVSRLTLTWNWLCDFKELASLLELYPKLNELIIKFESMNTYVPNWIFSKRCVSTSSQRLKRIDIDICFDTDHHCDRFPYLQELVEYLLGSATSLEHFSFSVAGGSYWGEGSVGKISKMSKQWEFSLCSLLYKCLMASTACEVLFTGRYLFMSRDAGPNVLTADGKTITIDRLGTRLHVEEEP